MIFPPLLKKGDKVAIIAPAGKLPATGLEEAIKEMTTWGLEVILGKHVYDADGYFAGKDEDRLYDLQLAFDDPDVAAILCGRGGYGITRILQRVDFNKFIKNPKWLVGFSDITALHLQLLNLGVASIHGPMATSFLNSQGHASLTALKSLLFNGVSALSAEEPGARLGVTEAQITGGNLSLIIDSLGTANEIDTRNKILFLEEVGEKTYRIDRMLHQLLRADKLAHLAGLAIGHFTDIEEGATPFGRSWKQVILDITAPFSYPVGFGFKFGHEPENMPIVIGGVYQLKVDNDSAILSWKPAILSESKS